MVWHQWLNQFTAAFERRYFCAAPQLGWITFPCLFWEKLGVLPLQRLLEWNSSWVSWNESLAHLALAQCSRSLAELASPAALLLMGIGTLFVGQHQQIWWDQLFWLSVMRSCSVTAIKYLETTAKPRKFPVRQGIWNTEVERELNYVFLLCIKQDTLKREINGLLKFKGLCLEALEMTFLSNLGSSMRCN